MFLVILFPPTMLDIILVAVIFVSWLLLSTAKISPELKLTVEDLIINWLKSVFNCNVLEV